MAPFLLTHLLLELLKKSDGGRIVNVSSATHAWVKIIPWDDLQGRKNYDSQAAYNVSKLSNVLFTVGLSERLAGTSVTANCLHPGWPLKTGFGGDAKGAFRIFTSVSKWFARSAEYGARTSVYLAGSPEVAGIRPQLLQLPSRIRLQTGE